MSRGLKRSATSDSNPVDFALRSNRVMEAPSFDVHRAKSSRQHLVDGVPLDVKRAESAHQHVRALNNQFASWIQLQMQDHPDELWEDGVKDYLAHATNIMEKFKDVVDWLRANAKSESARIPGPFSNNIDSAAVSENSRPSLKYEFNNGCGGESKGSNLPPSGFSSSRSSDLFSMSQTAAKSLDLQTSSQSSSQNSASLSLNRKSTDSGSQSMGSFGPQSTGFSSISQIPSGTSVQNSGLFSFPTPTVQTSGLFTSQTPGAFGFSQTLNGSNLQNPGLPSTPKFGLFDNRQTAASLGSQTSGFFGTNQLPAFGGFQSSTAQKVEEAGEADEENELEQPSSPSLKKTEEKGVVVVHEAKCKVYVKPDKPEDKSWKDMGMGQLSIKCKEGAEKAAKESKPIIIVRNDVGKILLNALIYPGIKINVQKNTIVAIFYTSSSEQDGADTVARTYLLRLKSEEETNKLATTIQDYAPAA